MVTLQKFLIENKIDEKNKEFFNFAANLDLEKFITSCKKGNWILWLFEALNKTCDKKPIDFFNLPKSFSEFIDIYPDFIDDNYKLRILVAGHCANTVRHLMNDERSIQAVDVALKFGEDKATQDEFYEGLRAGVSAYLDAIFNGAAYESVVQAVMGNACAAAACAANAVAIGAGFVDKEIISDVYDQNQKLTADIARKYLPIEVWNKSKLQDKKI